MESDNRTVRIVPTEQELAKLEACAKFRPMNITEVVQYYLSDGIDTDCPATTGTFSRRQLYRDYR